MLQAEPDIDNTKIFVFGRSLGGAVAIQLGYHNSLSIREQRAASSSPNDASSSSSSSPSPPLAGLILENTFTSTQDVALHILPFLSLYIGWNRLLSRMIIRDQWNSIDAIGAIECPILFISFKEDTVGGSMWGCLG